ncbi:MAG: ATP-binding protein [bacterium]|nr:ATP-binding protein [bacterium]
MAAKLSIANLLRARCHIDFRHYKPTTVARRIERRMQFAGIDSLAEYERLLKSDAKELELLFRDMLIGVTKFFRDPDYFDCLASGVLPDLFERVQRASGLRVWVAGCATGEEAYSMAILLAEARRKAQSDVAFTVLATDVHPDSLAVAAEGSYAPGSLENIPANLQARYFTQESDQYRVHPELRKCVVFSNHNVLEDPPFTDLDLICCRNLLIYFEPAAQQRVLSLFHHGLAEEGYLFLGPSETVGTLQAEFKLVDERAKIYRRATSFSLPEGTSMSRRALPHAMAKPLSPSDANADELQQRLVWMEEELGQSRDQLQLMIEELEASNEELQTTNEELISSNEQLQSTNEELNSVNEELHTVNIEYQQKNAELIELNEDLNHLFASTNIATLFLDSDLRIRRFTPSVADIFELCERDIGRKITAFSHHLEFIDLHHLIAGVLEDGASIQQEVRDQTGRYFFLRLLPYRSSDVLAGVVLTLTDISGLVESKHLVAQYQQRLQDAIDAVPVFLSFVNHQQRYEFANKAYRQLVDDDECVIGKSVLEVIGQEAYEVSKGHLEQALLGQPQQFEQKLQKPSGEIYLSVAYVPARNRDGIVSGVYVAATDVTEVKQAQRNLARAVRSARKANQAKSDFLAKMSHEIRSPMTAILGFADILDEQLENPDNKNAVEVIRRNGEHLLEIINDILDLARIEAGKLVLENSQFDARQLLVECLNTVIPKADQYEVLMELDVTEDFAGIMRGDRRRLRQVIMNLLTNAVKFSSGGRVVLEGRRAQEQLRVTVIDNGCGIPQEVQKSLFEPFCQADNSNERKFEGTGLGLTISKQLVEQMGGNIQVESQVGLGSKFRILLPWASPQEATQSTIDHAAMDSRSPRLDGHRILVIDDRRDIRFLAEHILSDAGAQVVTAKDGQSGIDQTIRMKLGDESPDLIITDIQMPEMDGFETTKRLRDQGYQGPVLALSASAMASDRARALAAGCDEHIAKPIRRKPFLKLIRELLD